MPIHDVGYRTWKGEVTSAWTRWWTISEAGIRTAMKGRWIRRILLASWLPVIYFGVIFFMFEKMMTMPADDLMREIGGMDANMVMRAEGAFDELLAAEGGDLEAAKKRYANQMRARSFRQFGPVTNIPGSEPLLAAMEEGDERKMRTTTWNWALSSFLRYPQGMITLMIVGLIVPPLISRDVRSRAFLLYYSRPITRMEYLIGKIAIPGFVLTLVTLIPTMTLFMFALMLSPDLSVLYDTWGTPFRIVLATAVCVIPTSLIGLLFSSMTQESRFAGFAWFTVWGLGAVVWWMIYLANSDGGSRPFDSNWSLISIYATIGRVQSWIFGLETDMTRVWPSLVFLAIVTVAASVALYRRVSAPVRI